MRSCPVRRSTKISMHSRIVRRSTTSMVVTVLMLPRFRRVGGARRPVSRYTGPIARVLAYARPESDDAGKQQNTGNRATLVIEDLVSHVRRHAKSGHP